MNKDQGMDVFEKAPVGRAVLQNVLPAMAAMLMVLVYNLADTFFIGQTRDALQVAAVSLATPVFLLFMAVGSVFGMGGTSVISRAMGEGRREYAQKVCSFCMWSCVGVGLVMAALFLLCMDQILALVGASPDTWAYAKSYLTIVSVSGPFVLVANCYSNVIRAEGQSGRAMMGQLLGNLLNVVLDPLFILVFHWEITGAAIATVIGNVVGAGLLYRLLFGVFYVLVNALQACGAATESLIVNISRQGLVYIPAMFLLGAAFHEQGLIWAQPVADVLSLLLAAALYMRKSRKMMD